jgi:hypothetical protein
VNIEGLRSFWDRGPFINQSLCECDLIGGQLRGGQPKRTPRALAATRLERVRSWINIVPQSSLLD